MKNSVVEPQDGAEIGVVDLSGSRDAAPTVYDLGYHVLSTLSEADAATAGEAVKKLITDLGAEIIADRAPTRIDLAYTMDKKIDGVIRHFDAAYFGWIAFALPSDKIREVDASLTENGSILRHLIVETSRAAIEASLAEPVVDISTKVLREEEKGGEVSEAALDTALKQMETDDAKAEEKSE